MEYLQVNKHTLSKINFLFFILIFTFKLFYIILDTFSLKNGLNLYIVINKNLLFFNLI